MSCSAVLLMSRLLVKLSSLIWSLQWRTFIQTLGPAVCSFSSRTSACLESHTQELKMQCLIFWSQRYARVESMRKTQNRMQTGEGARAAIYLDVSARQCDLRAALRCEKCHKSNERHDERRRFVIMYARPHRGPPRAKASGPCTLCMIVCFLSSLSLEPCGRCGWNGRRDEEHGAQPCTKTERCATPRSSS